MDLLLRFPSPEAAVALGTTIGATTVLDGGGHETAPIHGELAIHVIGEHGWNPTGDGEAFVTVPGWWVMVRAPEGYPIPPEVVPLIVEPDPGNPAIPLRVWA